MTSLPVIIIGVNPFGLEAAHIFQKNDVVIYGFLDDDPKKKDTSIGEIPVLGTADDESYFKLIGKNCGVFVALENPTERKKMIELILEEREVKPVNAIHPSANIADVKSLAYGVFIGSGAQILPETKLGDHVIIGSGAGGVICDGFSSCVCVFSGDFVSVTECFCFVASSVAAGARVVGPANPSAGAAAAPPWACAKRPAACAIAATVATGGAAAPLVAFTGLRLLMSAADARAARECVRCAEANLRGENLKPPPLGPNALGNWLHGRLKGRYGEDKAKVYAAYGSTAVALGLFALTAAIKVPATAAKLSVKAVKTATLGLMALVWSNDTWVISKGDRQRVSIDEARRTFREAEAALRRMDAGDGAGMRAIRDTLPIDEHGQRVTYRPADLFLSRMVDRPALEAVPAAITPAASQARAEAQEARGIGRGMALASLVAGLVNDMNAWLD